MGTLPNASICSSTSIALTCFVEFFIFQFFLFTIPERTKEGYTIRSVFNSQSNLLAFSLNHCSTRDRNAGVNFRRAHLL